MARLVTTTKTNRRRSTIYVCLCDYACVCASDLTSTIECDLLCFAEIDARHAVSMRWSVVSTSFDWEIVPDLIGPMWSHCNTIAPTTFTESQQDYRLGNFVTSDRGCGRVQAKEHVGSLQIRHRNDLFWEHSRRKRHIWRNVYSTRVHQAKHHFGGAIDDASSSSSSLPKRRTIGLKNAHGE